MITRAQKHKFYSEEYLLRHAGSKEPIPRYSDFQSEFAAGSRIQMSVVFPNNGEGKCPRCNERLPQPTGEQTW